MKNYTTTGIMCGLVLALIVTIGNWALFFLALALAAIGGLIGAHFDRRLNLVEVFNALIGNTRGQG